MQAKFELHDQEDQLARIINHPQQHYHDHVQRATTEEHHQKEPGQSPPEASHSSLGSLGTQEIRYQIASLPSAAPVLPLPIPQVPVPNPKPVSLSKLAAPAPISKKEAPSGPPHSFLHSEYPSSGLAGEPGIVATFVDLEEPPSPNHKAEQCKVKIESHRSSLGSAPPSTPLSPHHCSSQQATESIPHPSLSTSTPQPPNPGFTGSAAWRRRLSKTRSLTTMTASVKRSLSTPNVQQAAAMAAEGPSSTSGLPYSTGKGRNKLGYHRTSVACGHCRRRKIRCLLAKDDLHGRCSNCIRLKKECNFYPVENTDRRPRSMSKPDINSQDSGSSGSSPSPGFGPGQLSGDASYPVSVPVTPTWGTDFEFGPGAFEHQFLQNGITRPGRIMGLSQSASVSRRPSMAQMHTPATVKVEPGYSDLAPRWELPSQPESSTDFSSRAPLEDPSLSSVIWRATSGPMTGNSFAQQNISNTPLPTDSIENFEEGIWTSQAPSRMGSIDQGMNLPFSYQSAYSSDADLGIPPEMYSTNASTASLTASVSESSHYGDHQFYSTQWAEHGTVGGGCDMEGMRLDSDTFDQASFADEEPYISVVEGGSPYYPSPLQSAAPVSMSQR